MSGRTPSRQQLHAQLRRRIAATIPEGSGAEIKNLCEALYTLEGKGAAPQAQGSGPQSLTVKFVGDADDYSL